MKNLLLLFTLFTSQIGFGQMKFGFDAEEARDMISLCNSYSYQELFGSDASIVPKEYKLMYTSEVIGMDNKFQVFVKEDKTGVLCFRGSTDNRKSWMENFYSAMVRAKGEVTVKEKKFTYNFSEDTAAAVHAGYTLGLAYMHTSILSQIKALNEKGVYQIFLTGHSQGGALCLLLKAYLESLRGESISIKNQFKVYTFANPMVGNESFSNDYNKRFAANKMSYSIINPEDPIPKMPLEYVEGKLFDRKNFDVFFKPEGFDTGLLAKTLLMKPLGRASNATVQFMSRSVDRQIEKELGQISMPDYVDGINYSQIENKLVLEPFEYPYILSDSSILENDSLMAIFERDENGFFADKSLYKKQPMPYQHKPHNYYIAVLKAYFKEEYDALPEKYLKENL